MTAAAAHASSGKSSRRRASSIAWAIEVTAVCREYGLDFSSEHRALQAGKPVILRVRGVDAELVPEGGTAVLTLYATGSWTWGGDADAITHVREPLDRAGVLS